MIISFFFWVVNSYPLIKSNNKDKGSYPYSQLPLKIIKPTVNIILLFEKKVNKKFCDILIF